ncbi:Gfo/Idh/MocA family oxidoreductase [candidate division KSB1 bacterium]|nr:Gfo/Idh/MocA family oxidoreductase [candidate division KSB1 bacterium]
MIKINRRHFVKNSTRVAATASLAPALLLKANTIRGANERINVALIGCGGRGRYVARGLIEQGAELSYLCDLDAERMSSTAQFVQDVQERTPKRVKDMRTVFDDKNVDAVAIATPDHWHALATVRACQAGKDVYVEKPHAHSIWESRQMINAGAKYGRIIQVGVQNRSAPFVHAAKEYVQSGTLGSIGLVKVYNLKSGDAFWLGEPGTAPLQFDWDAWLGPAPYRPYHQKIFSHGWLYFWDYCNGDLSDDGIHQFDLAFYVLGDPPIPTLTSCSGGRFVHKDDADVPDTQSAVFTFDNLLMTLEGTNYPRYMQKTTATIRRNDEFPYWTQNATRIELYGSELMMTIGRHGGGWQVMTSGGKVVDQLYGRPPDEHHYRNFLDCVKSRQKPNADIQLAHNSLSTILLASIAHRIGNQTVEFDSLQEKITNNNAANKLIKREPREKYQMPEALGSSGE